ncbi:MAG: tol-pal system-associated acyl-CoA thioesterase [Alphaproteobacteria bacterium]|nr:tol-pal system-associated acyl-CoA thioesterase [Alphaproteobacteria bacterium]
MADPGAALSIRVYYEDTDAGEIVYYANYLRFLERGRTEWLRHLGHDHRDLRHNFGLVFAVKRCELEFVAPARLDDLLTVRTAATGIGAATLDMRQTISHEERLLVEATVRLVSLDPAGKVRKLPDALRATLAAQAAEGAS